MSKPPTMQMILEYVGPGTGPEAYQLWACRGEAKGCRKHAKRRKHCEDCILPETTDTLAEVEERLRRGNA